jgi:hypothetical protein
VVLLQRLKPEIKDVTEQLNLVSSSAFVSAPGSVLNGPGQGSMWADEGRLGTWESGYVYGGEGRMW